MTDRRQLQQTQQQQLHTQPHATHPTKKSVDQSQMHPRLQQQLHQSTPPFPTTRSTQSHPHHHPSASTTMVRPSTSNGITTTTVKMNGQPHVRTVSLVSLSLKSTPSPSSNGTTPTAAATSRPYSSTATESPRLSSAANPSSSTPRSSTVSTITAPAPSKIPVSTSSSAIRPPSGHSHSASWTPTPADSSTSSALLQKPPTGNLSGSNIQVFIPHARTESGAPMILTHSTTPKGTSSTTTKSSGLQQPGRTSTPPIAAISLTSASSKSHTKSSSALPTAALHFSSSASSPSLQPSSARSTPSSSPRSDASAPFSSVLDQSERKQSQLSAKIRARVEADLGDTALRPIQPQDARLALKRGELVAVAEASTNSASPTAANGPAVISLSLSSSLVNKTPGRSRRPKEADLDEDDDPSLPIEQRRKRAIQWLLMMIDKKENPLYCPSWFTAVDTDAMLHLADVRQHYLSLVHSFSLREQALSYIDDVQDAWMAEKQKIKGRSKLNMMRSLQKKTLLPTPSSAAMRGPNTATVSQQPPTKQLRERVPPTSTVLTLTPTSTSPSVRTVVNTPATSLAVQPAHTPSTATALPPSAVAPTITLALPTLTKTETVAPKSLPTAAIPSSHTKSNSSSEIVPAPLQHLQLAPMIDLRMTDETTPTVTKVPESRLSVSDALQVGLRFFTQLYQQHQGTSPSTFSPTKTNKAEGQSPPFISHHNFELVQPPSNSPSIQTVAPLDLNLLTQFSEHQIRRVLSGLDVLLEHSPLLLLHEVHRSEPQLSHIKIDGGVLYWNWKLKVPLDQTCGIRLVDIVSIKKGLSPTILQQHSQSPTSRDKNLSDVCFHLISICLGSSTLAPQYHELSFQVESNQHRQEWMEGIQLLVLFARADEKMNPPPPKPLITAPAYTTTTTALPSTAVKLKSDPGPTSSVSVVAASNGIPAAAAPVAKTITTAQTNSSAPVVASVPIAPMVTAKAVPSVTSKPASLADLDLAGADKSDHDLSDFDDDFDLDLP